MMFGECHAHIFMNGADYKKAAFIHRDEVKDKVIREHLREYQERSITYIRDGGDNLGVSIRAKQIASEVGITYRTPGFAIHKKGKYGSIVGNSFDNMNEFRGLVGKVRQIGGHFVKIMITGIMDFSQSGVITGTDLKHQEVQEMIHIAHEEGFAVMAHANGADAVRNAVLCGVDSIEHGYYLNDDCLAAMAASEVVWVPTLAPVWNLIGTDRFSDDILKSIKALHQENVRKAYQKGVQLAVGSDAGAYGVLHGQGTLNEYQALCDILGTADEVKKHLQSGEKRIRLKF